MRVGSQGERESGGEGGERANGEHHTSAGQPPARQYLQAPDAPAGRPIRFRLRAVDQPYHHAAHDHAQDYREDLHPHQREMGAGGKRGEGGGGWCGAARVHLRTRRSGLVVIGSVRETENTWLKKCAHTATATVCLAPIECLVSLRAQL